MHCVEFLGIPGSGKTTIKNKLCQRSVRRYDLSTAAQIAYIYRPLNRRSNILTYVPAEIDWLMSKFCSICSRCKPEEYALSQFQQDTMVYSNIVNSEIQRISTTDNQRELLQYWFNRMASQYILVSQILPPDRSVLIDEGFFQRTISIFCSTDTDTNMNMDLVEQYLNDIPVPDDVIIVNTPMDVVKNRLDKRGWPSRCQEIDRKSREMFLKRTSRSVEYVEKTLRKKNSVTVHTVDGTNKIEDSVKQLEKTVF